MRRPVIARVLGLTVASLAVWGALPVARAQGTRPEASAGPSAADKATARQLATEGIRRFQAGDPKGALEQLERAQTLYDAPVHLLYIARSQEKLGRLVEAAETYRTLLRTTLPAGAPPAFKEAVASAGPELAALEPRVPGLLLEVSPAVPGLAVTLDGETVSVAALGVERPVNPGDHVVRATAPGYQPAEGKLTVAPGEKKRLALTLQRDPTAAAAGPPSSAGRAKAAGAPPAAPARSEAPPAGAGEDAEPGDGLGFELGLRFGGVVPVGTVRAFDDGTGALTDERMSEYFEPGGGGELYFGLRFLRHFGARFVLQAASVKSGRNYEDPDALGGDPGELTATSGFSAVGVTLLVGTGRGRTGGFGELGFFSETWSTDATFSSPLLSCEATESFSGSAFRFGGGAIFPVADWLQLSPFAHVTTGSFGEQKVDAGTCPGESLTDSIPQGERRSHTTVSLGIGGEWVFGGDG